MSIISIWIIAPRLPHSGLQSPKFTNKAIFLAEMEENVSKGGNSVIFSWRSTDGNCGVLLRHELFYLISTPQDCCWKLQSYPIMAYWRKKTSILSIHTRSLNQQLQGLFGFQSHTPSLAKVVVRVPSWWWDYYKSTKQSLKCPNCVITFLHFPVMLHYEQN